MKQEIDRLRNERDFWDRNEYSLSQKVQSLEKELERKEAEIDRLRNEIQMLLEQLERLEREYAEERVAHNAHVAQLCRAEEENQKRFVKIAELVSTENRKLREERDKLIGELRIATDVIGREVQSAD